MSTEPDLAAAKGGVRSTTQVDPDLASIFEAARNEHLSLRQKVEENSHARAMAKISQGAIGGWLGTREEKPGNIAFIVILICFGILAVAFFRMDMDKQFESFLKVSGILTSIITASLGYLFGSAHGK